MAFNPIQYDAGQVNAFHDYAAGLGTALQEQQSRAQTANLGIQGQQQALQLQQAQEQAKQADAARQRALAYQQAFQGLGASPTAQQFLQLNNQFPEFQKNTSDIASQWGTERTRNETLAGMQYLNALQRDPAQASRLASERAQASTVAGDPQMAAYWQSHADEAGNMGKISDPAARQQAVDTLRNGTLLQIAAINPKTFEDIRKGLLVPGEIAKGEIELKKVTQDIESAKLKGQVELLDKQIQQADSETRRGELQVKRDELTAKIAEKQKTAQDAAQTTQDASTQALGTVNALLVHPGFDSATGAGANFNTWYKSGDSADFRALLDTLKSQQFLTNVAAMKGTGALSDAEGARIEKAVANIDPTAQSPKSLRNALNVVKATLEKAQQKNTASGNLPTTGGAFVAKIPGYGILTEGRINSLMAQMPGVTRDQILEMIRKNTGAQLPVSANAPAAPAVQIPTMTPVPGTD